MNGADELQEINLPAREKPEWGRRGCGSAQRSWLSHGDFFEPQLVGTMSGFFHQSELFFFRMDFLRALRQ